MRLSTTAWSPELLERVGLGPDILLATHSTEIIAEADPNEVLTVTKKAQSAKRIGDPSQLRAIFSALGSNLNPTLTQLARSKRVVYVERKGLSDSCPVRREVGD